MRLPIVLVCAAAAAFAAAPAAARLVSPGLGISWGKAGITLAQYRADAIQCSQHAAATDLANTDPAKALVLGSRMIENDPTVGPSATIDPTAGPTAVPGALQDAGSTAGVVQMIGPGRQIAKAGDILERAEERCLLGKGYRKFKLTSEQKHRLSKLPLGSDARHAYLHSLASDPDMLTRQAIK